MGIGYCVPSTVKGGLDLTRPEQKLQTVHRMVSPGRDIHIGQKWSNAIENRGDIMQ